MLQDSPQCTDQLLTWYTWCLISLALLNPSSLFSFKQGSCTRWCHPAGSSLPSPLPSQLSCFPSSLSSPLSSCLVLHVGVCYVILLVDVFPSSVQHCSPMYKPSLSLPCLLLLSDGQERGFFSHEHLNLKVPVNFTNKCFYQKMDSEWQAKGTCITNLKNFMLRVSSRVQLIQRSTT